MRRDDRDGQAGPAGRDAAAVLTAGEGVSHPRQAPVLLRVQRRQHEVQRLRLPRRRRLLPASMLQRPLRAEDMAAIAVKATSALADSRGCRRGGTAGLLVFPREASKAGGKSVVAPEQQ